MEKVHGTYRINKDLKGMIEGAAIMENRSFNNMLEQIVGRYFNAGSWGGYEADKAKLKGLSPSEYEKAAKAIARKHGV